MSHGIRVWREDGFLLIDTTSKSFSIAASGSLSIAAGATRNFSVGVPNASFYGSRLWFCHIWEQVPLDRLNWAWPTVSWSLTSGGFNVSVWQNSSSAAILRYWVLVR